MDERVAACAVVGREDARLGERVVAFVQPAPGTEPSEPFRLELEALCGANLARYKTPDEWIFVAEMPRNAMNKILKADLKQQYFR
jgi:fatty-acyl-CoA synthase